MTEKNKLQIWEKRWWTHKAHEPEASFKAFKIKLQHPAWTYKKIAEETGTDYGLLRQWAFKYHYNDRLEAKTRQDIQTSNAIKLNNELSESLVMGNALQVLAEIIQKNLKKYRKKELDFEELLKLLDRFSKWRSVEMDNFNKLENMINIILGAKTEDDLTPEARLLLNTFKERRDNEKQIINSIDGD